MSKKIISEIVDKTLILKQNPKAGQIEELLIDKNQEFRYLVSGKNKIIYYINPKTSKIIITNIFVICNFLKTVSMKNICKLILVFILPILFGCKDEKKIQRKEFLKIAKTYFSEELKNTNYKSLDSLRILKIDTLSDKDELYLYICQLYRYKNHLLSQSKSPKDLNELKYGTDDFGSQMYEDYVNKLEYKSVKENEAKSNVLRDSIDFIKKQIKHYEHILVKKDSLNLCMYEVTYFYQITNKNMITEKGDTYLLFTKDMKIIENKYLEIKNLQKFPFIK